MNNLLAMHSFFVFTIVLMVAVPIIFVIILVMAVKKGMKNKNIFDNNNSTNIENPLKNIFDFVEKANSNTCEYCGSTFDKNEHKCPNCGAQKK